MKLTKDQALKLAAGMLRKLYDENPEAFANKWGDERDPMGAKARIEEIERCSRYKPLD